MNKKIIIIVSIIIVLIVTYFFYYWFHPLGSKVIINNTEFRVDLALTNPEKERGLGYRDNLLPSHGMLFVYDNKQEYIFWMKGMNFPLDFIWIEDNKVVDVTKNVPMLANGQITTVKPKTPVNRILEINAGEASKFNIQIGDIVIYKN